MASIMMDQMQVTWNKRNSLPKGNKCLTPTFYDIHSTLCQKIVWLLCRFLTEKWIFILGQISVPMFSCEFSNENRKCKLTVWPGQNVNLFSSLSASYLVPAAFLCYSWSALAQPSFMFLYCMCQSDAKNTTLLSNCILS